MGKTAGMSTLKLQEWELDLYFLPVLCRADVGYDVSGAGLSLVENVVVRVRGSVLGGRVSADDCPT